MLILLLIIFNEQNLFLVNALKIFPRIQKEFNRKTEIHRTRKGFLQVNIKTFEKVLYLWVDHSTILLKKDKLIKIFCKYD